MTNAFDASPGPVALSPPVPAPPVPAQPTIRRLHRGWATVWIVITIALLLAAAAVVMSVVKLTAPAPMATTRTVMAPSPPSVAYSAEQVAAAKKEACDASGVASDSIRAAHGNFVGTVHDRQSPEYRQALGNFQLVTALETEYMRLHLPPATPKDVADATNQYVNAWLALVDANTREVSNKDADTYIAAVRTTGDRLNKVCGE